MTYKDAIGIIKGYKMFALGEHEWADAFDFAVEALEKQIPKKPKIRIFESEIFGDMEINECPNCSDNWNMNEYVHQYCPECGQAIDWSDEQ